MDRLLAEDQSVEIPQNFVTAALRLSFHADSPEVLDVLYRQVGAHNVMFMTTNHNNREKYWSEITREDVLETLEKNVVLHSFLELPNDRKGLVKAFQKAAKNDLIKLNHKNFAEHFQEGDRVPSRFVSVAYSSSDDWFLFCEGEEDCKALTLDFLEKQVAPYLAASARHGIWAHLIDTNGKWLDLYYKQKEVCKGPDSTEAELQECEDAKKAYYLERHNDKFRAITINGIAAGEKTFIGGASVHGSRNKDFEEFLNGRSVRIDAAPNYMAYEKDYGGEIEKMRTSVKEFGEDPPKLVYFWETKTFAITSAGLKDDMLMAALKEKFDIVPYDKLRAEKVADVSLSTEEPDEGTKMLLVAADAKLPTSSMI